MEEIINNYTDLKNFVLEHKGVLENDDYNYIYKTTVNDDIKKFLIENGFIIVNDEQYITTLFNPNKKDILITILKKNSELINTKNKGNTLLDNTVKHFVFNILLKDNEEKSEYMNYIIFILSKGGFGNLSLIYQIIKELEELEDIDNIMMIYSYIIDIIDIFLLYGAESINIDKNNELYIELFKNMIDRVNINISDNLRNIIEQNKDIVKIEIYNFVSNKKNIENTIIKINQNDKYIIYEEDNIRWVFNEEDVKKIVKSKLNPYTGKIILDKTLEDIKKNYKIDF